MATKTSQQTIVDRQGKNTELQIPKTQNPQTPTINPQLNVVQESSGGSVQGTGDLSGCHVREIIAENVRARVDRRMG